MKKQSLLVIAKVFGGILFVIQMLLFLFYWNWPFEAAGGKNYLPFIFLGLSMAGYLITYFKMNFGGMMIILGGLGLTANFLLSNLKGDFNLELLLLLIVFLPCAVSGTLFLIAGSQHKLSTSKK